MKLISVTIDDDLKSRLDHFKGSLNISALCRDALWARVRTMESKKSVALPPAARKRIASQILNLNKRWQDWARTDAHELFLSEKISYDEAARLIASDIIPKAMEKAFSKRYFIPPEKIKTYDGFFAKSIHFLIYKKDFIEALKDYIENIE